jgi:hypothetical protein
MTSYVALGYVNTFALQTGSPIKEQDEREGEVKRK